MAEDDREYFETIRTSRCAVFARLVGAWWECKGALGSGNQRFEENTNVPGIVSKMGVVGDDVLARGEMGEKKGFSSSSLCPSSVVSFQSINIVGWDMEG